jgi:hypothetical protein
VFEPFVMEKMVQKKTVQEVEHLLDPPTLRTVPVDQAGLAARKNEPVQAVPTVVNPLA